MADLFDNVYTHCKSFNGAECINNGERCKFREGDDGCKIENITGEVPILWDNEDRESIVENGYDRELYFILCNYLNFTV